MRSSRFYESKKKNSRKRSHSYIRLESAFICLSHSSRLVTDDRLDMWVYTHFSFNILITLIVRQTHVLASAISLKKTYSFLLSPHSSPADRWHWKLLLARRYVDMWKSWECIIIERSRKGQFLFPHRRSTSMYFLLMSNSNGKFNGSYAIAAFATVHERMISDSCGERATGGTALPWGIQRSSLELVARGTLATMLRRLNRVQLAHEA